MKATVLAGLAILWPVASWAADITPLDAKLGLWESATTTSLSGGAAMPAMPQLPEATLAKMPPQQRAQIEAMMKARGGQPIVTKVCLTRESLSAGAFARRDKSCNATVVSSSASKQVVHMDCTQGEVKSTGDMTVELVDPEHIKGTMLMKSSVAGQARDMSITFNNKWLAADCGDVKPVLAR